MKQQWQLFVGLLLSLVIIVFAAMNTVVVPVQLGFGEFSTPLIIIIFGAIFMGAVLISLLMTSILWKQKKTIKQLKKEKDELEAKIEDEVSIRVAAYLASSEVDQKEQQAYEEQLFEEERDQMY
ncbi:LapA family protein [Enterococcus eurekensis]|uniref:Lipopolysaccharide assembly LapA domain-containing protein n=1 Tax=Enterococcus eurekensis TaxID=1159753 RepID=A0ABV9M1R4_9ENTE